MLHLLFHLLFDCRVPPFQKITALANSFPSVPTFQICRCGGFALATWIFSPLSVVGWISILSNCSERTVIFFNFVLVVFIRTSGPRLLCCVPIFARIARLVRLVHPRRSICFSVGQSTSMIISVAFELCWQNNTCTASF